MAFRGRWHIRPVPLMRCLSRSDQRTTVSGAFSRAGGFRDTDSRAWGSSPMWSVTHAPGLHSDMDPKLGLITAPLMVIGMIMRSQGPASKFRRAGAISPSTAIRSSAVGIERRFMLESDLRRGLLVERAGRFYVDPKQWRRRTRRKLAIVAGLIIISIPLAIVLMRMSE